ncbi:MAG: pentapeptide repeat-containing protein, partial [Cyclobacteriaceae bacterium]|nr:pentapeptide repeat-containing protein [Cyclobacteriaceae bacterium]
MTVKDFFDAFKEGQRHFIGLEFEYEDGFSNRDFSNVTFEGCFLYLDFRNSNLSNSKFIRCNIKDIDLRGTDLTNSFMTKCLV